MRPDFSCIKIMYEKYINVMQNLLRFYSEFEENNLKRKLAIFDNIYTS